MSEVATVAAPRWGSWFRRVVLPLVEGGDVRVDSALATASDSSTSLVDDPTLEADLLGARAARLATFCTTPLGLPFDDTTQRLGRGFGNLVALCHPGIRARTRAKVRDQVQADLESVPLAEDADEQLRRLTLTWRLFSLARTDTRVHYWAGEQRFVGQPVPRRLLAWSGLRRVHQEQTATLLADELLVNEGSAGLMRLAVLAPLAVAYEPLRAPATLLLDQLPTVLVSPRLMRLCLGRATSLGLDPVMGRLAAALAQRLQKQAAGRRDLVTVRFFAHALLAWCLAETVDQAEALRARFELGFARAETPWQVAALFAAAYRCGLAVPMDVSGEAREKVKLLYEATAAYAGDPRVKALVAPLREVIG